MAHDSLLTQDDMNTTMIGRAISFLRDLPSNPNPYPYSQNRTLTLYLGFFDPSSLRLLTRP
jgi:hypothetical protein